MESKQINTAQVDWYKQQQYDTLWSTAGITEPTDTQ